jgi:crossover junction endodeoxyribonuclease RusA
MLSLPFPPATLSGHANGNGRWKKINETKALRAKACEEAKKVTWPNIAEGKPYTPEGDITVHITFVPPTKQGDRMNFPARAKPLIDGLADALGVNDARFVPKYYFSKPEKPGRVEVRIGA